MSEPRGPTDVFPSRPSSRSAEVAVEREREREWSNSSHPTSATADSASSSNDHEALVGTGSTPYSTTTDDYRQVSGDSAPNLYQPSSTSSLVPSPAATTYDRFLSSPSSYAPSELAIPSSNIPLTSAASPLSSASNPNHELPALPLSPPALELSALDLQESANSSALGLLQDPLASSTSLSSAPAAVSPALAPAHAYSSSGYLSSAGTGTGTGIGIGIDTRTGAGSFMQSFGEDPASASAATVPTEFDEGVLRALCDLDCGLPLLLDRLKQSMSSCRETSNFLKKRAQIEDEYARSMSKLVKSSIESYGLSEGKAGTFVNSYVSLLKSHDLLADNRIKFASQLAEMAEELSTLNKEVDRIRKSSKDLGTRLERGLSEQDAMVDKARTRFDSAAEELERLLLVKSGESLSTTTVPHAAPHNHAGGSSNSGNGGSGTSKGRSLMSKLKGPKNPAQIAKQEEEMRSRMGQASDSYRAMVQGAQGVKQEYFNLQLPKLLRTLKEGSDEIDLGTQYHLSRYAYLFESLLVTDGLTISPVSVEDGPGVKAVVDAIDSREDFKTYMQQYALNWQMSGQKGPKRDAPGSSDSASYLSRPQLSPRTSTSQLRPPLSSSPPGPPTNPTFGVDLGDQMLRDAVEVPRVLEKCAEAIELYGLESMGIYRLSGTTSRVQRLKNALDRDLEGTDLLSEDNLSDINDIAAVLKLWFRELPEPLLTWELYHQFIDVSKIENDRLRHIRLHERVNELPDPNYATLKFLMGHLDKVAQRESSNQMSVSNLAIVFGPNLLSPPPPHLAHHFPPPPNTVQSSSTTSAAGVTNGSGATSALNGGAATAGGGSSSLADTQYKCKCVETILAHYKEIFVE
ncbi:uncharacterized protein JCM15063_001410 [Sporobolomyces koalae]|uniref:uncharacterized protein n=1 Tax=Sporobolomyces koalae TaxID=500713 RepID=UPI0031813F47